jgi:hypothetical protein
MLLHTLDMSMLSYPWVFRFPLLLRSWTLWNGMGHTDKREVAVKNPAAGAAVQKAFRVVAVAGQMAAEGQSRG